MSYSYSKEAGTTNWNAAYVALAEDDPTPQRSSALAPSAPLDSFGARAAATAAAVEAPSGAWGSSYSKPAVPQQHAKRPGDQLQELFAEAQAVPVPIGLGQLQHGGFDARGMLAAGFNPADIFKHTGATVAELLAAGCSLQALCVSGWGASRIPVDALIAAGFSPRQLKEADVTNDFLFELKPSSLKPRQLLEAGYTAHDLIYLARFTAADFRQDGVSARQLLEEHGCFGFQLEKAGYTQDECRAAAAETGGGAGGGKEEEDGSCCCCCCCCCC